MCAGQCDTDDDCAAGSECQILDFDGDPVTQQLVGLCIPKAGSGAACTGDASCTTAGEHCGLANDETGALVSVCRAADAGDVDIGEQCDDDPITLGTIEPTLGCVTNLCIDNGRCTSVCTNDSDCGTGACLKFPVNDGDALGVCFDRTTCVTNADCGAGEACSQVPTVEGARFLCVPQIGDLDGGETCDVGTNLGLPFGGGTADVTQCFSDADCTAILAGSTCNLAARQCLPPLAQLCELGCNFQDNKCTQVCVDDTTCGTDGHCEGSAIVTDPHNNDDPADDDVDFFGVCQTRTGAYTTCSSNADCTSPDVCQPTVTLAGVVEGRCANAIGDVAAGDPCGVVNDAVAICASGFCEDEDANDGAILGTCRDICADDTDCTAPATCQAVVDGLGPSLDVEVCK